jgi:hypothetical protein
LHHLIIKFFQAFYHLLSQEFFGYTTTTLSLNNSDIEIILSPDATVDLMGNLKFKVADRADVLRFYPLVLKE